MRRLFRNASGAISQVSKGQVARELLKMPYLHTNHLMLGPAPPARLLSGIRQTPTEVISLPPLPAQENLAQPQGNMSTQTGR